MAKVLVIQNDAHLATDVKLEHVKGTSGLVAKATLVAISNRRRGAVGARVEQTATITWTVWDKQVEAVSKYLTTGSHVNIVGRMTDNRFKDGGGEDRYESTFTIEEIDFLDTKAEAEARRQGQSPE